MRANDADGRRGPGKPLALALGVMLALSVVPIGCRRGAGDPGAEGDVDLAQYIPELDGMVLVPGGDVDVYVPPAPNARAARSGQLLDRTSDRPRGTTRREAVAPFFMDRFEVTNADYARYLAESGRPVRPELGFDADGRPPATIRDRPVTFVDFEDARAYAEFYGKRLPSAAEWTLATRGVAGRSFPWGRTFNRNRLNCLETGIGSAWLVGTFESGKNPAGCYDLVGNVWEWAWMSEEPAGLRAIVGGSFLRSMSAPDSTDFVEWTSETEWSNEIGFRCVRSVGPEVYARYLDLLDSRWRSVRLRALDDLFALDPSRAVATLELVQRGDPDPYVRAVAANRLVNEYLGDRVDVPQLVRTLASEHPIETRMLALKCLSLLAVVDASDTLRGAAPALLDVLEAIPREMHREPPRDPVAVVPGYGRGEVTRVALFEELAGIFVRLGDLAAREFLVRQARLGKYEELRIASAEALGSWSTVEGADDPAVAGRLADDLYAIFRNTDSPAVRTAAFDSLIGVLDDAVVRERLIRILVGPERKMLGLADRIVDARIDAAYELAMFPARESVEALGKVLSNEKAHVELRLMAASSLLSMSVLRDAMGEVELDPYLERRLEFLDQGMPAIARALDTSEEGLRYDIAATLSRFVTDVDIPRLVARRWLDAYRFAPYAATEIRPWLEVVLAVYRIQEVGPIEGDLLEYVREGIEPDPPVFANPFLVRARCRAVDIERSVEVRRDLLRRERERAGAGLETPQPPPPTLADPDWFDAWRDVAADLERALQIGHRDAATLQGDRALSPILDAFGAAHELEAASENPPRAEALRAFLEYETTLEQAFGVELP